jgi:hypothetical protein
MSLSAIGQTYKQIDDFKNKLIQILLKLKETKICDAQGQLIDIDGEIISIEKYYEKFIMVKKVNVRKPIELLYEKGITKFARQILTRNEQFFLGEVDSIIKSDLAQFEKDTEVEIEKKDLFFIKQVRLIWDYLDHNSNSTVKKNIWDYVQVICLLAEKVVGGTILKDEKLLLQQTGQITI